MKSLGSMFICVHLWHDLSSPVNRRSDESTPLRTVGAPPARGRGVHDSTPAALRSKRFDDFMVTGILAIANRRRIDAHQRESIRNAFAERELIYPDLTELLVFDVFFWMVDFRVGLAEFAFKL